MTEIEQLDAKPGTAVSRRLLAAFDGGEELVWRLVEPMPAHPVLPPPGRKEPGQ